MKDILLYRPEQVFVSDITYVKSKASASFTKELFDAAQTRLENADYSVAQTPFGYFLELKIDAPGSSLARIWASL